MHDTYLCFSPKDSAEAAGMRDRFEQSGLTCIISDSSDRETWKREIADAYTVAFLYTDNANMDSLVALKMDYARKIGTEIVTLRCSNSMPLGRLGFYMTIPYTIDARELSFYDALEQMVTLLKQTKALVIHNRQRKAERESAPTVESDDAFLLPGFSSGKWYLTMLAIVYYVFASAVIVIAILAVIGNPHPLADVVVLLFLFSFFALPVLFYGNAFSIRTKYPLFSKSGKWTSFLFVLLAEGVLFLFFSLLLRTVDR